MATKNQTPAQGEQVVSTVSSVETFFMNHKNVIEWGFIAVVVVVCACLAVNKWYLVPAKEEAKGQMFVAEQQFRAGEWDKALNGDGTNLGFNDVISTYGAKAGKSVYFYAGVCNLKLGNNEEAVKMLGKYNGKDNVLKAKALCCTGDAWANLGDLSKALSYYKKAIAVEDNMFVAGYLLKAGIVSEEMGNKEAALTYYKTIETKYPQTLEGYDIAKYISRIENAK